MKIGILLVALAFGSDVTNLFTAMQSMVNEGELDGLELLQGYIKNLKSYNTAQNNHQEQGNVEKTQKTGPILTIPSSWDEFDDDHVMEDKNDKYDGLKGIMDEEFSQFRSNHA